MESSTYTWIAFYEEFASKLLSFKGNRTSVIEKIRKVYTSAKLSLPTLENGNNISDIDPFTIFGLFNKGISDSNRIKLAQNIKAEFSLNSTVPSDFTGIPVLNNMSATFYGFGSDRQEHDIDNLWRVFEAALNLAASDNDENRNLFINAFDVVRHQYRIKWNLTFGLYWIRPYAFISLDSKNRDFLRAKANGFPEALTSLNSGNLPDATSYLAMRDALLDVFAKEGSPYKSFPEFSYAAWKTPQPHSPSTDNNERSPHYWIYAPGRDAEKWEEFYASGIMGLGWDEVGDLSSFPSKKAINEKMQEVYGEGTSYKNSAHMTWLFSHEMKPGDIVFVKKGRMGTILGRGIIQSNYTFDATRNSYKNILRVKWTHKGDWTIPDTMFPMKTLTDITPYNDLVTKIRELFEEDDTGDSITIYPPYTKEDFLHEVYMNKSQYASLTALLKKKKNIILQGAPGVGKTFIAKKLAYSIMGEKDTERVMLVQFHQSYSYEDFIMGYRPTEKGFDIHKGAFYDFCKKATDDNENDYYCIIDEINRGNLNKIFGELFMLLEADKRGEEVQLLYKDEKFSVPPNLYLIGTMNTADRSLAMLDYALRRRFSFFDMTPGFDTEGFQAYQKELANEKFDHVIRCVRELNDTIAKDETLGDGFCIGHSYFCGLNPAELTDESISSIIEYDIIPLLKEYWFDEPAKVRDWSERLRRAVQ